MTKFQALYILYLRHSEMCGCSWRALAAHYYNRYNSITNELKQIDERIKYGTFTFGGNQIDGIELEKEAFKILSKDIDTSAIGMDYDLFDCDLHYINANVKNHLEL